MAKKNKSTVDSSDNGRSVISKAEPASAIATEPMDKKKKEPKSGDGSARKNKPRSADSSSMSGKAKSSSRSKSKANTSREKSKPKSSDHHANKSQVNKDRSKPKSSDGRKKSKTKSKEDHRSKHSKHSKEDQSKSSQAKTESASAEKLDPKDKNKIGSKVRKIEATKGAIAVSNESAISKAGYALESGRLFQSDYSQVLRVKKSKGDNGKLVVKVINLTECSPRSRANLLQNSVRIMRYIGDAAQGKKKKGPLSPLFIAVADIYLVNGVKLFIFMQECDSSRTLYDLVKSSQSLLAKDIRTWFKAIISGVHELQRVGVAHRAVKLQHILFDAAAKPKLCGWGKSVFYFEPSKKRILKQHKERRVRHNYHLPPEAFMASYDPSKADIWSCAVVLVAMCTKRYPFNVRDKKTKFSSQWREFIKTHELNTHVRNLCHKTFIIDPTRRISSGEILAHKYFKVAEDKLEQMSCKADSAVVKEDSRVGGVSAIDMGKPDEQSDNKAKDKKLVDPPAEDEAVDWTQEEKADESGVDENATGFEGGNVGEEENLPAAEQEEESATPSRRWPKKPLQRKPKPKRSPRMARKPQTWPKARRKAPKRANKPRQRNDCEAMCRSVTCIEFHLQTQ